MGDLLPPISYPPPGAEKTNRFMSSQDNPNERNKLSNQYLLLKDASIPAFASKGDGWAELHKIVKEMDEKRMQNHVTDIDTALVFTGLFSAVLTAFLLESMNDLRPPSQDVTVRLMHQIALQTRSYSMGSGYYLNTTDTLAPLFILDSFQPQVNAVRVNVIWFTALTLSLITASLAILVKQWLRENLSGERTSPQEFFRVRDFKYAEFDSWGVFEIVATVYLLQQVYLALFLVGLCFYTEGVRNEIGRTTFVLVVAWGVLLGVALLAPIFFPRCPYRTGLLIHAVRFLRAVFAYVLHYLTPAASSDRKWGGPQNWIHFCLQPLTLAVARLKNQVRSAQNGDVASHLYRALRSFPAKMVSFFPLLVDALSSFMQIAVNQLTFDDKEAALRAGKDIDILSSLDYRQKDPNLLKHIWDALQPSLDLKKTQKESADCIVRIFQNHSRDSAAVFPDLEHLPYADIKSGLTMLAHLTHVTLKEIDNADPEPNDSSTSSTTHPQEDQRLKIVRNITCAMLATVPDPEGENKATHEQVQAILLRLLSDRHSEGFIQHLVKTIRFAKNSTGRNLKTLEELAGKLRRVLACDIADTDVDHVVDVVDYLFHEFLAVDGDGFDDAVLGQIMVQYIARVRTWANASPTSNRPYTDLGKILGRLVYMLPVVQESRRREFTGLLQRLFEVAPGPGVLAVCLCMFGPTEDYYAAGLEEGKTLFVNAVVSDKSGAVAMVTRITDHLPLARNLESGQSANTQADRANVDETITHPLALYAALLYIMKKMKENDHPEISNVATAIQNSGVFNPENYARDIRESDNEIARFCVTCITNTLAPENQFHFLVRFRDYLNTLLPSSTSQQSDSHVTDSR